MDVIAVAFKDLLKFKLIAIVNTGDKTYDNLIIVFVVAILNYLFLTDFLESLKKIQYKLLKYTNVLNQSTFEYYKHQLNSRDVKHVTWYIRENTIFIQKLNRYLASCGLKQFKATLVMEEGKLVNNVYLPKIDDHVSILRNIVKNKDPYPIYIDDNQILGIVSTENGTIEFVTTHQSILEKFYNPLMSDDNNQNKDNKKSRLLIEYYNSEFTVYKQGEIFPDRTFECFFSKHKSDIIRTLDNFKDIKTGNKISKFGGYNLGILIYGAPGTGKTTLIKAIANYLGMNVMVVDSRKFNKKAHIEKLYSEKYRPFIKLFEEFDCMQGAISRENVDTTDIKQKLRDEDIRILEMMSKCVDKDSRAGLEKKLATLDEEINNVDNYVTTDLLLTVLDGMIERRGDVTIMDTNHPEKIDPALLREGRIDLKIHLDLFDNQEIKEMLNYLYDNNPIISKTVFRETAFSPAKIMNLCCKNKDNLHAVINELKAN